MKRKKITIFFVAILLIYILIRKTFALNGSKLNDVIYKSENLIVRIEREGKGKKLVVLGSGYSLDINEEDRITNHDPLMVFPNVKDYNRELTIASMYFPFESDGLEIAGQELANFINSYGENYEEIIFIGHSKCGVCFANMAKWVERPSTFLTISAPFTGTKVVSQEEFAKNLNGIEKLIYKILFNDHKVDKDIAINSEFLQNADFSGLENFRHINVISVCHENTLNPIEILLKYMDYRGNIKGDGIVSQTSQYLSQEGTIQEVIRATHATSMDKGIKVAKKYIKCL